MNIGIRCAIALSCAGCSLATTTRPMPPMPAAFERATPSDLGQWPGVGWYREFGDPELDALMVQATAENFDLGMARSRVLQADARARRVRAGILPTVDAGGSGTYLAGHSAAGSAHESDGSALIFASYEVDFWGKNRALADSATFLATAARADCDTVAMTTLAAVADGYFWVLSLRERLAIARADADAARTLLHIVENRFRVGSSTPVQVATQRTILAMAELAIPQIEQTETEGLGALAVLLGRSPEGFRIAGVTLEPLQEPTVRAGLPSELLRRRPDVRAAESNLRSASADFMAARAALYPSLSLTAAGGVQNPALNAALTQLSGVGPTINVGAALTQPLWDGGRLRAARAEAQARENEVATTYRAAIIAALVDVENALAALHHLDAARDLQLENAAQSERAFDAARLRYQAGYGDFLSMLEAQRTLYAVRDAFSQYKLARFQALVSLYKALGGGWSG